MEIKGMLKRVSCIALAGLVALSGQALGTDAREVTLAKIEQVDSGTIWADKVLGYGTSFDLRNYEYLSIKDPKATNSSWAIVVASLLERLTDAEYSAKFIDYATAVNSTKERNKDFGYNRNLGDGGNMQLALGFLTSGRTSTTSNTNIGGLVREYSTTDTTTAYAKDFAWNGILNTISQSSLTGVSKAGRIESYVKFPAMYKKTWSTVYYTGQTREQMETMQKRITTLENKTPLTNAERSELNTLRSNLKTLQAQKEVKTATYAFSDPSIYSNLNTAEKADVKADYTKGQIEQNREAIKAHIIKYGAVAAQLYRVPDDNENAKYPQGNTIEKGFIYRIGDGQTQHYEWYCSDDDCNGHDEYYKSWSGVDQLMYYCQISNVIPNESVMIIGWDDEIEVPGAPGKGAYLVMDPERVNFKYPRYLELYDSVNGWYCKRFGSKYYNAAAHVHYGNQCFAASSMYTIDTNFYWVSYYDYYIESNVYGIKSFSTGAVGKTYQHDDLGMSTAIQADTKDVYGANVFVRDTAVAERLNSISIASMDKMRYEVYVNPKNSDLTSDSFIKVAETEELDAGYNTIYFDDKIMLTGEEFVVAVKYISTDSNKNAKIGVQSPNKVTYIYEKKNNTVTTTKTTSAAQYWNGATLSETSAGCSFMGDSLDTLNKDLNDENMAICIKAYTMEDSTYSIPAESIEIQKISDSGAYEKLEDNYVAVLKGDQIKLGVKPTPEDAVINKINWKTDKPSIASIDKDGVVTALEAGKVTITAQINGSYSISTTCTVDVRVPIESFVLNKSQVTILPGESHILAGLFGPEDVTTTKIQWSTSDSQVVKVTDDGLLIGLTKGTAVVTATVIDESGTHTATCSVTVPQSLVVDVTNVSLNKNTLTLQKGARETLKATVTPADATNTSVVWTSSDKNIAIVNANGRVTALAPGKCTITVTTVSGGLTQTCEVTVTEQKKVETTGITLNQTALSLDKDTSAQLVATVTPSDADDTTVYWSSSDLSIARVTTSGKVTARTYGTATITAKTADGKHSAKCVVTIEKPTVKVTGVTLNKTAMDLEKDATYQLIAGIQPASADNGKVIWKTSNANIVKVDENGNITAVGYGDATITVTTDDGGYSKTCIVTVPKVVNVTGIQLSKTSVTVKEGRTSAIEVKVLPEDATNEETTYEISDESIISFGGDGIKGLKAGTATITFTTTEGEYKATCTVTVEELEETDIDISSEDYTITDDNKISDVPPETTVEDLKNEIKTEEGTEIVVKDKDGNVLEDTDIVGTGSSIEISKEIETTPEGETEPEKSTVTETFEIIVSGDVNGDGWLSATDVSIISQAILGETTLDDTYIEAGDLNGDGKITITDLTILMQQVSSETSE